MNLKLLMFSPAFYPSLNPEALVNSKLALTLIKNDFHIDIITRNNVNTDLSLSENSWSHAWNILRDHVYSVDYKDNKTSVDSIINIWECLRSKSIVSGNKIWKEELRVAKNLQLKTECDIIMARALPVAAIIPAFYLSINMGKPLIININDPTAGAWPYPYKAKPLFLELFENIFLRKAFNHASAVTFPSERLKKAVLNQLKIIENEKHFVIPHIALESDNSSVINKTNDTVFTICHAGNFAQPRNPETFFKAMQTFIKIFKDISLILIGHVSDKDKAIIAEFGLTDMVKLTGVRPYEETAEILRASSVQVIIEAPVKEGIFLPSKFVDYIQNGRPILAVSPKCGTVTELISEYRCGEAADCTNSEEIFNALCKMHAAWESDKTMRIYDTESIVKDYSTGIVQKYKELFDIVSRKHCGKTAEPGLFGSRPSRSVKQEGK